MTIHEEEDEMLDFLDEKARGGFLGLEDPLQRIKKGVRVPNEVRIRGGSNVQER